MVGYTRTRTGYMLWNANDDEIKFACNVVFVENKIIRDWECDKEDNGNVRRKDMSFAEIVVNEIGVNDGDEVGVDNEVHVGENLGEEWQEETSTSRIGRERKMLKRFDDYVVTSYVANHEL